MITNEKRAVSFANTSGIALYTFEIEHKREVIAVAI